jgi:hypothetical protein
MNDRQEDRKEPVKNSAGSEEWPATRWPEPQPVKKLETALPHNDEADPDGSHTAAKDPDSTLNEGWEKNRLKSSRPKRAAPKLPEPLKENASPDDSDGSCCV